MGNNIAFCTPSLTRNKFFPGNRIDGAVVVKTTADIDNVVAIRVEIVGEFYARWTTGSGKHRRTHTVRRIFSSTRLTLFGNYENSPTKQNHKLKQGDHAFPFAMVLSPSTIPSATIHGGTLIKVQWFARSCVEIGSTFTANENGCAPFTVFSALPQEIWARPSPSTSPLYSKITCCCCISKGELSAEASMQKTILALDRDAVAFSVKIDASKLDEPIDELEVSLVCFAKPIIAATHRSTSQIYFQTKVKCNIAAHSQGVVNGVLPLRLVESIPASLVSSVIQFEWKLKVSVSVDWATDPDFYIPVTIVSTVIADPFANVIMQQQQAFVPMDENAFQQRNGMFEVANMAQGRTVLPPPPPSQFQQPQMNWNMAPPPPPPPGMSGGYPGLGGGGGYPGLGSEQEMLLGSPQMNQQQPNRQQQNNNGNNKQFTGFNFYPDSDFFAQIKVDSREQ